MINTAGPAVAIRAMLYLALQPPETCSTLHDIASHTGLPRPYLAKVMRQLSAAGFVRAFRGPGGGVALASDPRTTTLWTIARSIDPSVETEWCLMGLQTCSHDRACPLHDRCAPLRAGLRTLLQDTTLARLKGALRHAGGSGAIPWFRIPERARRPSPASAPRKGRRHAVPTKPDGKGVRQAV
jgi:Rrf2 family protein